MSEPVSVPQVFQSRDLNWGTMTGATEPSQPIRNRLGAAARNLA